MENTDYEMVRNLTILFFFERLMVKGAPRTLHDLSCQFGAKGFTKEMRQIAGGSQSGLKKFLSQYPSIFAIQGDFVDVNNFASLRRDFACSTETTKRDYAREAVEYFREKLLQYGPGTEVPIKSLLGHRSQARPEVRHISGQHIKEFKEFLMRFPDTFVIRGEHVILKEFEDAEPQPFHEIEKISVDPELKAVLIEFLYHLLELKGPLLVELLYQNVTRSFPEEEYSCLFKTPQDLATFLKMHSDTFLVQSNLVTLVNTSKKPFNDTIKTHVENQNCDNENNNNNVKSNLLTSELPPLSNNNNEELTPKVETVSPTPLQNQTLKQRINSVVMKTLADNSERDKNLVPNIYNKIQENHIRNDELEVELLSKTNVVKSVKEGLQIIDDLFEKAEKGNKVVVGLDCEGVNLGSNGYVTLVQLALPDKQIYIYDLVTFPQMFVEGGISKLLTSDKIIKVIHDCRSDSQAIHKQYGVLLKNVFDTQVAYLVIQFQDLGKPIHSCIRVSLSKLYEIYGLPGNKYKDCIKVVYKRDQKIWCRRPMTRVMLLYAASDVSCLLNLYDSLVDAIKPENMKLFSELCEEFIYSAIKPEEVKFRWKQRKLDAEAKELNSRLSSLSGESKKIVLSNKEIRLLRYLELTDDLKNKLRDSYKVRKKLEKLDGVNQKEQDKNSDSDTDAEFPSLELAPSGRSSPSSGGVMSPRTPVPITEPISLTESMQMVDEILSDTQMDRLDKIKRLEEILSAATSDIQPVGEDVAASTGDEKSSSNNKVDSQCFCNCHIEGVESVQSKLERDNSDVACQTLSTGDIVITKMWFTEEEKEKEKTLISSTKRQ
ncbi:UNVERIFIED_CONTAM: hypothetical protein PYX00_004976 [Menopon gallinae]|uniref:3'-5' exonuclease domain-containing protein n=1 Tax=Menopon gallinae TaxID=328185 RepID=A0AAW2I632_9NEOP